MTRIENAIIYATRAHEGQMRKDGVTPYIIHPLGVAESVRRAGGSEDQYIAALLHDVIEDCNVTAAEIVTYFGQTVADLVVELTNVYTKEAYPHLNRATRKQLEDERIATISDKAKLVKVCDIAYNINDLQGIKGDFKKRLIKEKLDTLKVIIDSLEPSPLSTLAIKVENQAYQIFKHLNSF